ncbi:MAG: acyltransferase [Actinobacteria bacterium]|nr:acyltransferase [Actinomycetota bacterium]
MDTRQTTDYIKGIALFVVLFAHYTQHYHTDFYLGWISIVPRGVIALFFVLSGYAIYCSLERRLRDGASTRLIARFYLDRALRIYPLYWLALLITPFFFPGEYRQLHELSWQTAVTYLGGQSLDTTGIFWFVPAIIQCYLAAPFIYLLLRKLGPARYLLASAVIIALLIPPSMQSVLRGATFSWGVPYYLDLILGNLILFSMGLAIKPLLSLYGGRLNSFTACLVSWTVLEVSLFGIRYTESGFQDYTVPVSLVFILACFCACLFSIALNPDRLFLQKALTRVGRHSYPVYLLHMAFFGLLATLGIVSAGSFTGDIIAFLLLPLFILLCAGTDSIFNFRRVGGLAGN